MKFSQLTELFKLERRTLAPRTYPCAKGCWACSMNYLLRKAVPYWSSTWKKEHLKISVRAGRWLTQFHFVWASSAWVRKGYILRKAYIIRFVGRLKKKKLSRWHSRPSESNEQSRTPGAHQMEPPSPTQALGANSFPSRFIIRTVPRGDFARRGHSTCKRRLICGNSHGRRSGQLSAKLFPGWKCCAGYKDP